MALDQAANFVREQVTSTINAGDTTVNVTDASDFPVPPEEYNIVVWDAGSFARPDQDSNVEIMRVTDVDTTNDVLTVARGQEGTTDVSHPDTSVVVVAQTAKMIADIASEKISNPVTETVNVDGNDVTNVGTLDAEQADITRRDEFQSGYTQPIKRVADTADYDSEPYPIVANNGDLLLIYRSGVEHSVSSGAIVLRRSTDFGETWGDTKIVADPYEENRNPSAFKDPDSGRIIVFFKGYDSNGNTEGAFYTYSDDGQTWSSPTDVTSETVTAWTPIGGGVQVGDSLMTLLYKDANGGYVEALFSGDGGQTWGNTITVADTESVSGRTVSEPTPLVVDDDRLIVFGRENTNNEFYAVTSSDGGSSWDSPEYFNLLNNGNGTPLFVNRLNDAEALCLLPRRASGRGVFGLTASLETLWDDPKNLQRAEVSRIKGAESPVDQEFGYATFTQLGDDKQHVFLAYYDETSDPNIWAGSFADSGAGSQVTDPANVTGSRSLNTWYCNDTGQPLYVTVTVTRGETSVEWGINFDIGVNESADHQKRETGDQDRMAVSMVVPAGFDYRVNKALDSGTTLSEWTETRFGAF